MPEPRDPIFPYHRIVDDLRSAILAGRLAPGDRLSSEWELAEQYQTSRPTVRRAIAVLKAEGLVITEQGRGAFVRPKPGVRLLVTGANYRRHRSAGLPSFNAQVIEQGQRPEQSRMPTRSEIDQLRLSPRVPVIRVLRTIYDTEGAPLEVQDSVAAADCHEFRYEVEMR